MLQFEVIVMIVRLGTEADFLYVYLHLFGLHFFLALLCW